MRLKNILLVVNDIEKSKRLYTELFGLQIIKDFGENVMLSDGLVLQEKKSWEQLTGESTIAGNASEIFFEENDLDAFISRLDDFRDLFVQAGDVRTNSWGKKAVMFKDIDGHLIEVAEK